MQKRRTVVVLVNCAASSGRALLSAAVSSPRLSTAFHVILYSPARSTSEPPIFALIAPLMVSASAYASSISACSSFTLLTISCVVISSFSFLFGFRFGEARRRVACKLISRPVARFAYPFPLLRRVLVSAAAYSVRFCSGLIPLCDYNIHDYSFIVYRRYARLSVLASV